MARVIIPARLRVPVEADASKFAKQLGLADKKAQRFGASVSKMAKGASVALASVTAGAVAAGAGLAKLAKNAAPLPGVMQAYQIQAQRAGLSLESLRKASQKTITDFELMKQANVALTGAGDDLAKAFGKELPTLLMGARAAARAQGKSVQFMFESIVSGVKRSSPMLIDNTGIVLKLGAAYASAEKSMGVAVEQMSGQQKSLAVLGATTEAINEMLAQMGGLQLTSAERAQRVQVVYRNLGHTLGLNLLPALDEVNDAFYDIGQRVGPRLVQLFETRLGPALAASAGQFRKLANKAVDAADNLLDRYGERMLNLARNALTWGINVSSEFAAGLVQGASSAIVTAMNDISKLLTFWMAPGSPPRVAPNLDKWGLSAARSFMDGFTEMDFSVLGSLQDRMNSAFQALVSMDALKPERASELMKSLSVDLMGALKGFEASGRMPVEIFAKIREAGGKLGKELEAVAKGHFEVLRAQKALERAQRRVTDAHEGQSEAQKKLTALIADYTKAQRDGADEATLKAKRAAIEAAKQNVRTAHKEVQEAEAQQEAAEKALEPAKDRVSLQEQLLAQMTKLTEMHTKALDASKLAGGGAGGPAGWPDLPDLKTPDTEDPDFSPFSEAFEEARKNIEKELDTLAVKFSNWWEREIRPSITRIRVAWAKLQVAFDEFWNHPAVVKVREWLGKLFPDGSGKKVGKLAGKFLVLFGSFKLIAGVLGLVLNPLTLLIVGLTALFLLIEAHGPQLRKTILQLGAIILNWIMGIQRDFDKLEADALAGWSAMWETFRILWDEFKRWIDEKWAAFSEAWTQNWDDAGGSLSGIKGIWEEFWGSVKHWWDWLSGKVFNFKINLPSLPDWATPGSPLPIHTAWKDFAGDMGSIVSDLGVRAGGAMSAAPMPSMATAGALAGNITIENHFGPGSVRNDRDIYRLAEEIARSLERRKLRRNIT